MSTSSRKRAGPGHAAFWLASSCACGIIVARAIHLSAAWWLLPLAAAVTAAFWLLAARREGLSAAALLFSVAALGAYAAALSLGAPRDSIARLLASGAPDGAVLPFRGVILDRMGARAYGGKTISRYTLKLDAVKVAGEYRAATGIALIDSPGDIRYGSAVEGVAFWKLPAAASNPGQFDYRGYLRTSGVTCLASAGVPGAVTVTGIPARYSVGRAFAALRRTLLDRLSALGLDSQGVIPAVLLGDRTALADSARDSFVRSGTMHLLAISGMNLAMVAGLFLWLLRLAGTPLKTSSILTLIVATIYVIIVGPLASVVRAGLMLGLFCLAIITDRPARALDVVSTAALIMLVARPLHLFDAGFQLSFVSVLGLFYVGLPLGGYFARRLGGLKAPMAGLVRDSAQVFAVSLGTGAAVAPLVAYHFKVVSLVSPFANLLLIPITWVMTVAGFAAMGLSFVSAKLASLAALSASGAETALLVAAGLFAKAPLAYAYVPAPPLWIIAAAYAIIIAIALAAAAGRRVAPLIILSFAAADVLVLAQFLPSAKRPPEIVTLSDSHAAAVVAFDGRGRAALFIGRKANASAATNLICPFLLERGVTRLDLLVETAGADARIRDALRERIGLATVVRQRRFAGAPPGIPPSTAEPPVRQVGPGDALTGPSGFEIKFHSGRPIDFLNPVEPYFEGLVVELTVDGRRAVIALDATDGCLAVAAPRIVPAPKLLCVVSNAAGAEVLTDFKRRVKPEAFVVVGGPERSSSAAISVTLADPPEVRKLAGEAETR
jgi:competence protein ComEC